MHPDTRHGQEPFDFDDCADYGDCDDGLPGWPLTTAMILGLVITMPIWFPVCLLYAAGDHLIRGRR